MASSAYQRFVDSMPMNLDRWRDGIGYDLAALEEMTPAERESVETLLLSRSNEDWRDIDALAALGSERATNRLRLIAAEAPLAMALVVLDKAPELLERETAARIVERAFESASTPEALSRATDLAETHHSPAVVGAILRRIVVADGPAAYDLGALLLVIHGVILSRWDMGERELLLRLTEADPRLRAAAMEDLVRRCGAGSARA